MRTDCVCEAARATSFCTGHCWLSKPHGCTSHVCFTAATHPQSLVAQNSKTSMFAQPTWLRQPRWLSKILVPEHTMWLTAQQYGSSRSKGLGSNVQDRNVSSKGSLNTEAEWEPALRATACLHK